MATVMRSRRALREALGATPTELDTLERQGVIGTSHRGPDGRVDLYDEVDTALAALALQGFRIGARTSARELRPSRTRACTTIGTRLERLDRIRWRCSLTVRYAG